MNPQSQEQSKINDPGELNQRKRIEEIAEARKNARNALADPAFDVSDEEYRLYAAKSVQVLAAELEWLVRDNGGEKYFTAELGPVTISPPSREEFEEQLRSNSGILEVFSDNGLEPKEFEVSGLYTSEETGVGFLDYPTTISATWEMSFMLKGKKLERASVERQVCLPESLSMNANRLCREFINEVGLDVELDEGRPMNNLSWDE